MKVAFGAQSKFLLAFYELYLALKKIDSRITGAIFFVSDAEFFYKNQICQQIANDPSVTVLKEWKYTSKTYRQVINQNRDLILASYKKYNLRNAILCDRRLMYGSYSKIIQDYNSRYSDSELENIILHSIDAIESCLSNEKVLVVTPTPSCFGDYLLYLFSQRHSQKYLQLKFTKIQNYICLSETFEGNTPIEIEKRFLNLKSNTAESDNYNKALEFIRSHQSKQLKYEGVILKTKTTFLNYIIATIKSIIGQIVTSFKTVINKKRMVIFSDRHVPPRLKNTYFNFFKKPIRSLFIPIILRKKFMSLDALCGESTFFYPMHSEPEIALNVNGRQWQNQIELIRRIAQSIPLGSKLVIKEHPRNVGYRKLSYYKKLYNIPNVYFINSDYRTHDIIDRCKAIFTVSGIVGFEAILRGKPVVVFGNVNYSCLEGKCLLKVKSTDKLYEHLMDFLSKHVSDETLISHYVSAVMDIGLPVNFYSDILRKQARVSYSGSETLSDAYRSLAVHLLRSAKIEN